MLPGQFITPEYFTADASCSHGYIAVPAVTMPLSVVESALSLPFHKTGYLPGINTVAAKRYHVAVAIFQQLHLNRIRIYERYYFDKDMRGATIARTKAWRILASSFISATRYRCRRSAYQFLYE